MTYMGVIKRISFYMFFSFSNVSWKVTWVLNEKMFVLYDFFSFPNLKLESDISVF